MDCSIRPTKHPDLFVISTTDFFYPNVDDPYMQGQIACANVLSDLYAMGVVDCENLLMLLSTSIDMPADQQDICTKLMIQGFNDQAKLAETAVTGGQTVKNPWPIIGGVAMSLSRSIDFIWPINAQVGDKLVLTKPLGTQLVANLHQWLVQKAPRWEQASLHISSQEVIDSYEYAIDMMSRLNRTAARLMHKHKAHGATDVTGFGLIGHASNLAQNQKEKNILFEIDTLPVIQKMHHIGSVFPGFNFLKGRSAETSGGLLIAMSEKDAEAFCSEIQEIDGEPAFIIGQVVKNNNNTENCAVLSENLRIIEVHPITRHLSESHITSTATTTAPPTTAAPTTAAPTN